MDAFDVNMTFSIGDRVIGSDRPCLVIAEVAQAHDGSLGTAHAFIDAIANGGADAVKFQTHLAASESTPAEPWRVRFSHQDATRYDYWKRMEFNAAQWEGLARHACDRGLMFLSSPFSEDAVLLLARLGMAAWKIPSGEVTNTPLLESIAAQAQPILLSSGMSLLSETDAAVAYLRAKGRPLAVLQCTSAYPCPPEQVGLNMIAFFRERYGCPTGLSDHSGTVFPGLAGAALGMQILEVHVTLSREMFGPDVPASITTSDLRDLVDGIRFIERMRASPVVKDDLARELEPTRQIFTKSVVARTVLPAGIVLEAQHLVAKKPGTGIPAAQMDGVIGRRLRRAVERDHVLQFDDLEP